jgi:hypothetical protein
MMECEKLSQFMKAQGMSTTWWEGVKSGTQDPWVKLKEFDTNKQMVQFNMKVDRTTNQVCYAPENPQ